MRLSKTILSLLIITLLSIGSMNVFAAAETIIINGTAAEIPPEMGTIQERDDRTFVPVRFIMEYLGCNVSYIDDSRTAVITSISSTYLLQEGNSTLFILPNQYTETEEKQMDTAAFIETTVLDGVEYGRMYVPIRFLAEAIGYDVGWDDATQTVTLTMVQ